MHYYQHHIGDFIKDTANLNDHQLATYMRMVWAYYSEEKPFTSALEDIAFAMRSDEKTIGLILRHYFKEAPDGWRHGRCDREIAEFHGKKEKAAASANARWSNAKNIQNAKRSQCDGNATASKTDANQEPITNNQEPLKESKDQSVADAPAQKKKTAPLGSDFLINQGATEQHAGDWLKVRKSPLTQTAWDAVVREAAKAGITPAAAVQVCAENSWRGFRADWYANSGAGNGSQNQAGQRVDNSAVGQVKRAIAEREAADREAGAGTHGQTGAENVRDIRPPLDGEFRRVV